jgi:hypothetical protein
VQYTINGYPRALETSVIDWQRSIEGAWRVRESFGRRALVWRYDTILFSSLTPAAFHIENFSRLAERLDGATDEVVVSFAQMYKKTERNLTAAAEDLGFSWRDPNADEKRSLLSRLLQIAPPSHAGIGLLAKRSHRRRHGRRSLRRRAKTVRYLWFECEPPPQGKPQGLRMLRITGHR